MSPGYTMSQIRRPQHASKLPW